MALDASEQVGFDQPHPVFDAVPPDVESGHLQRLLRRCRSPARCCPEMRSAQATAMQPLPVPISRMRGCSMGAQPGLEAQPQ